MRIRVIAESGNQPADAELDGDGIRAEYIRVVGDGKQTKRRHCRGSQETQETQEDAGRRWLVGGDKHGV